MDEHSEPTPWKGLYRAGGWAALIAVALFRRNFGAELSLLPLMGLTDWPAMPPADAAGWFALLHEHPFYALCQFGLVDMVNYVLIGLLFLAACGALRRAAPGGAAAVAALYWTGTAIALASNQVFPMWTLSAQYAAAGTEAQRAALVAAGQALLAIHNPGAVYPGAGVLIGLFLVLAAGLILSLAMRRSRVFGRGAAYVGLAANGIALAYFPALAFAPALIALPPALSALFRIAWYVLVALRLFRLARPEAPRVVGLAA